MEEKRFGVNIHLIEELRRFQSCLKLKRKTMVFVGNAYISFNNSPAVRKEIRAQDGRISIIPSINLRELRLPRQIMVEIDNRTVSVEADIEFSITIRFDTEDEKNNFVTSLGNLDLS